ncbi:hypothetical protein [Fischerella thermalis]|uniref:hypothetical protein n=1 Tax=Fischerella thermalis TaxID=372787 RepID=UPI0002F00B99|nr:hypothetical protein [Fischerella thermalis]MBF1989936.1 hypothetical protein [Fischerella thermalis M58_A2018_009]MBF2059234.1 hypothetical protein [Fischerella thermalis M66_A2018_004]MBF2071959.1 hypothetical protein [Fischerella thermalis M48_A2018_028]
MFYSSHSTLNLSPGAPLHTPHTSPSPLPYGKPRRARLHPITPSPHLPMPYTHN